MMDFAGVIDRIRKNFDIDTKALCKGLGIGEVTLENYVSGYAKPPKELLQRLFRQFSILGGEDWAFQSSVPGAVNVEELEGCIRAKRRFAVPVNDNALSELKIFAGSFAVIERCDEPENGDVVLASVSEGEAALYLFEVGEEADEKIVLKRGGEELSLSQDDFKKKVAVAGKLICTAEKI